MIIYLFYAWHDDKIVFFKIQLLGKFGNFSTQFLVFPISTRVDITVYQHGKCFIFVECYYQSQVAQMLESAIVGFQEIGVYYCPQSPTARVIR